MGIDLDRHHVKRRGRKATKSTNLYVKLLVKLYKFLARRTGSAFNEVVAKRLEKSRMNKPPVSLSAIVRNLKGKDAGVIAVAVADVTDDIRLLEVPKIDVCALRFTKTARARIEKAGGRCLTFDQLARERPTGKNTLLLRGPASGREAVRHFGRAPGVPNSHTKPYTRVHGKNRKIEQARGRRASRGFRN